MAEYVLLLLLVTLAVRKLKEFLSRKTETSLGMTFAARLEFPIRAGEFPGDIGLADSLP
jgi:hypothetical protein